MSRATSMEWVELHGLELVGLSVDAAVETIEADGLKVMVSGFPRPTGFPSPSGDCVYVYVAANQVLKVDAQ